MCFLWVLHLRTPGMESQAVNKLLQKGRGALRLCACLSWQEYSYRQTGRTSGSDGQARLKTYFLPEHNPEHSTFSVSVFQLGASNLAGNKCT